MRLPRLSALLTPLGHSLPLQAQKGLGVGLCWRCEAAGTPSLLTHLFQTKPCRCPRRVASIIERIDLDWASNLMGVIINLIAPGNVKASAITLLVEWPATYRDSFCIFDSVRQKFTKILISFFDTLWDLLVARLINLFY
jgi:hypothetical protein